MKHNENHDGSCRDCGSAPSEFHDPNCLYSYQSRVFWKKNQWPNVEATKSPNDRAVLLDEAGALIDGQRAKDYGDAAENFARIAHGWTEILGVPVTSVQVALCMDWLKTCRLITSPHHRDSWIDKLGYSALGGEVASK